MKFGKAENLLARCASTNPAALLVGFGRAAWAGPLRAISLLLRSKELLQFLSISANKLSLWIKMAKLAHLEHC